MTFTIGPNPTDLLSNSQALIKTNFSVSNNSFSVNHFAFSDTTANNGKHKFVEMPLTATVDPTTGDVCPVGLVPAEGTLYTATLNSLSNLAYTFGNSGVLFQMTRVNNNANALITFGSYVNNYVTESGSATSTSFSGGWTFLPGGLLYQYGSAAITSGAAVTVKFPATFTTNKIVLSMTPIFLAPNQNALSIDSSPTTLSFNVKNAGIGTATIFWTATGI